MLAVLKRHVLYTGQVRDIKLNAIPRTRARVYVCVFSLFFRRVETRAFPRESCINRRRGKNIWKNYTH